MSIVSENRVQKYSLPSLQGIETKRMVGLNFSETAAPQPALIDNLYRQGSHLLLPLPDRLLDWNMVIGVQQTFARWSMARFRYCGAFAPKQKRCAIIEEPATDSSQTVWITDGPQKTQAFQTVWPQSVATLEWNRDGSCLIIGIGRHPACSLSAPKGLAACQADGRIVSQKNPFQGLTRSIFTPSGEILASVDGTLRIFLPSDLTRWRRYSQVADYEPVAFSPDGKTLVLSQNGSTSLLLLDYPSGIARGTLKGHKGFLLRSSVRFSDDGRYLASKSFSDSQPGIQRR